MVYTSLIEHVYSAYHVSCILHRVKYIDIVYFASCKISISCIVYLAPWWMFIIHLLCILHTKTFKIDYHGILCIVDRVLVIPISRLSISFESCKMCLSIILCAYSRISRITIFIVSEDIYSIIDCKIKTFQTRALGTSVSIPNG